MLLIAMGRAFGAFARRCGAVGVRSLEESVHSSSDSDASLHS